VIAEGEFYGMQTFDQALLRHHQEGRVAMEDALRVATSPHDFKLLVASEGRTATSMDDIGGGARRADSASPATSKRPGSPEGTEGDPRPGPPAPSGIAA
jgi:twitching motility protein PilT